MYIMYTVYIHIYIYICIIKKPTIQIFGKPWNCQELENPFGQDINDIHLPDFHMRFVDCLQDWIRAVAPWGPCTAADSFDLFRSVSIVILPKFIQWLVRT